MEAPKFSAPRFAVVGADGADLCNARAVLTRGGPCLIAAFNTGKLALYDVRSHTCSQLYVDPGEDDASLAGQAPFGFGAVAGLAGAVIRCGTHDFIISVAGHDDGGLSCWCSRK